MRCLVTGGTGFLGRYVAAALRDRGRDVVAMSRRNGDLTDAASLTFDAPFDEVYHVAGLAHLVPRTADDCARFFAVNYDGTRNLLTALERTGRVPDALVLISSVAVYGREEGSELNEDTPRTAADPYGASKRQAEDLAAEWCSKHNVQLGVVRLPLIVGEKALGNLRAMTAALRSGRYIGIGRGQARRSMVWAGDVAAALPAIAQRGGTYHLTDGRHPSFAEIEAHLAAALGRRAPLHLPSAAARTAAKLCDAVEHLAGRALPLNTRTYLKMTSTLTFSDARARSAIAWQPSSAVEHLAELLV